MPHQQGAPDAVYPLGPYVGDHPELRYSLRSLAAHVPHGRLWIVGHTPPDWVVGAEHIPVPQQPTKYLHSTANLIAACEHPDVSDEFVLFNDDHYVLQPVDAIAVYHRGPLLEFERRCARLGDYGRGVTQTRQLLEQWGHPARGLVSYEVHSPMPLTKAPTPDLIRRAQTEAPHIQVLAKRTLIGNMCELGGVWIRDPKVTGSRHPDPNAMFLSSTTPGQMRGPVGKLLRDRFGQPGPYEQADAVAKAG